MQEFKNWVVARLAEPSTKRGFVVILTALLASYNPELREAIIAIGVAAFGVLEVVLKDSSNK